MKVLIACEESQTVCRWFRHLGHEAYSCDLLECSGGFPEWHIHGDVLPLLRDYNITFETQNGDAHAINRWDMMIAHPECTRLTVAANKYYKPEYAERFPTIHKDRETAVSFFMELANAPIQRIAIENPIGIMSTRWRKPDQVIQPYFFGDTERKGTCLWLKNLPKLVHTERDNLFEFKTHVEPELIYHKNGGTDSRLHYETLKLPKEERRKARSVTFNGLAKAMAEQWG